MTDLTVETNGLVKRYPGGTLAVDGVDLAIRRGEVYGLLGLNGAGKTTVLRCLLGLLRPTAGSVAVLGHTPGTREALRGVGALVEAPAFYPHLSGRRNLEVLARFASAPASRIDAVLETVGLLGRADSRFRTYSLGMRQRLGVAAALLKDPDLLVLDEPTNGLDTAGMGEMRDLVKALGHGARTVVFSSHLLGEVEQVCDRVGVIHQGRLIEEGTVDELRVRMGRAGIVVRATPLEDAMRCAVRVDGVTGVEANGATMRVALDPERAAALTRALVQAGLDVLEVRPVDSSLEEIFMALTTASAPGPGAIAEGAPS